MERVAALEQVPGAPGVDEVLAVLPSLPQGLASAKEAIEALRGSKTTVDLECAGALAPASQPVGRPWERAAALAATLRARFGLESGPLPDARLSELLSVKLPVPVEYRGRVALGGAVTNGGGLRRAAIRLGTERVRTQRFFLARLLGCVASKPDGEHLCP